MDLSCSRARLDGNWKTQLKRRSKIPLWHPSIYSLYKGSENHERGNQLEKEWKEEMCQHSVEEKNFLSYFIFCSGYFLLELYIDGYFNYQNYLQSLFIECNAINNLFFSWILMVD